MTITGQLKVRTAQAGAPVKFARQDHFPTGWQACIGQFTELFHRYGYIYKALAGGSWYSANEKWKLPDSEILKAIACAHPRFFIGCRAGRTSRFAVLDIDQNSKYHNKSSLDKLLKVLSEAGLGRSSLYRSSYSGGWHLYSFFEEPINSADLRRQLFKLLSLNDFEIAKGQLEIFPHPGNEGSMGLGLRLPLQTGFAWLNKKTLETDYERHELNATQALELFVDALDGDANSYVAFRQLKDYVRELEQRKESSIVHGQSGDSDNVILLRSADRVSFEGEFNDFVRGVFHRLPPGIIVDNWYKGRIYHLNGLTGPSQRAEAIECLGHYFFYGDPSRDLPALGYGYEQERQWAIEEVLRIRHNGYSDEINSGHSDALGQIERAAKWVPAHKKGTEASKYKPVRPVSWIRENANRKLDARKRITEALDGFKKLRRTFTTVDLQKAAGCSRDTLYRHKDLWRQDYEDLASGFFAICTDEYNVVEGAAPSKSQTPLLFSSEFMPPGRLAARRIAFEISMRNARALKRGRKAFVFIQEVAQFDWMARVKALMNSPPGHLDVRRAQVLISVLIGYLPTAPTFECQVYLQKIIAELQESAVRADFTVFLGKEEIPPDG